VPVFGRSVKPSVSVTLNAGENQNFAIDTQCSNGVLNLVKTHANGGKD